ncbi:hypothetical protein BH23ACT9_BH23ACT9_14980 [soil metagenome]
MTSSAGTSDDPSWWRLGRDGWQTVLRRTAGTFKSDAVPILAGGVTLRIVLSLVPSLIAAVAIAARFVSPEDIERLVAAADEFVPAQSRDFVTGVLNDAVDSLAQGSVQIVAILVGLVAASSAATMLIRSLNKAYDVEEERGFIGQRLVSLAILGGLVLALAGMFVALVIGPSLLDWLVPQEILDSPLRILITLGRYAAAVALLMLFFGFVFWLGPHRHKPAFRLLTPGAVFGVAGWLVLSYLFSLYVRIAGDFAAYGAAAGVVILLFWLNYSFTVLLMGAELNHEIERYAGLADHAPPAASTAGAPFPEGSRAAAHGGADNTIDLDAVEDSMPRHPGLVGARADASVGELKVAATPRPRPRLAGAATHTSGAAVAGALWSRLEQ